MMHPSTDRQTTNPLARAIWWSLAGAGAVVLAAAAILEPDVRGYGTHTQLGLPPCGFRLLTGFPCPGCGLTTAFAHAIRGDWTAASAANPLGLLLFLFVCSSIPFSVLGALRGWSLDTLFERFSLGRWGLALTGSSLALWVARLVAAF